MNNTLKLTLFASLGINLLLAGIVTGHMSAGIFPPPHDMMAEHKHPHGKPESPWKIELDKFATTLDAEKSLYLQDSFAKAREKADADKDKVEEMRKASLNVLRAKDFNAKTYMEQSQAIANLRNKSMIHFTKATIEVSQKLTPEERAKLAEAFDNAMKATHPPRQ